LTRIRNLTTRYLHTRPISVDIALNILIDEDPLAFNDPNGFSWLSSFFPIVQLAINLAMAVIGVGVVAVTAAR
jgi:hypothetical protein